jgi:hypothetical protein
MSAFSERYVPSNNEAIIDFDLDASNPAEHKLIIDGPATGVEIVSLTPAAGMAEGSNVCVVNDTNSSITLKHNDNNGGLGKRLISSSGADIVLAAGRPLWGTLMENSSNHPNGWRFEAP